MSTVITVILLTSLTLTSTGEAAQLTISPRPVYEGVPVTVRCSLGNIISQVDVLNSVAVSRRLLSNPSTGVTIASAVTLKDGGKAVLKDVNNFGSRATVTGKSDNNDKSGSFIQIQVTGMTCSDSREYFCVISYNTLAGSPDTSESSDNITIQTKPGEIEMIVTPRKEFSSYVVSETVEFRCNGNVGNPAQSWSWQWKYAADVMWMSYPYTERIKDDPPRLSGCKNRGSSVLNHTVSLSEKRRMFRCIVGNNELYSANFTINTRKKLIKPGTSFTLAPKPATKSTEIAESSTVKENVIDCECNKTAVTAVAVVSSVLLVVVSVFLVVYVRRHSIKCRNSDNVRASAGQNQLGSGSTNYESENRRNDVNLEPRNNSTDRSRDETLQQSRSDDVTGYDNGIQWNEYDHAVPITTEQNVYEKIINN